MHISSLMLCYQCKWEKEAYYQSPLLRSTHLCTVTGNKHLLVSRKQDILNPAYRRKQTCLPLQYWQVATYAFKRTSCSPVLSHKSLFLFVLPDTRQTFWRQQNFAGQGATGSFSEENWSVFVPLSKSVSGSAVATVRAHSGGSSSFIGGFKKRGKSDVPAWGRGLDQTVLERSLLTQPILYGSTNHRLASKGDPRDSKSGVPHMG